MSEILVSVIIPAYNCAAYIGRALDSALRQDVPMEILVIDDCSTDGLEHQMDSYKAYSQIRYLKNEQNLGVAKTRNYGVRQARGTYIAFLDADDCWESDKLKKQLKLIEQTGTVICSTARELMGPDGTLTGHIVPVKTEYTYRDLLRHNLINCSSVLIKREVALEFPMHHDDSHEDYLMWLEVLKKYQKGCAVNEPLLKYRSTDTGKSGSKWHSAKMTFRTYRNMGFGICRSMVYFLCYAYNGIRKYYI
jgi:teichuronic acid biosynthesis glycosyltransferase TuaG